MAEARIHLLSDTVVRAQAQLDEQKHYCFASLDTLVKLLPVGKSKRGRRKGLRVFNACGLQDSSRGLETCGVRASPRAPLDSQAPPDSQAVQAGAGCQVPEAVVQHFFQDGRVSPKGRASSKKGRASGVPQPVQQFSEGEAVAPTRKHGASTLHESSESRDELSAPVVSPKEHASSRKHQILVSPDEVPGAVQHFSEGKPASMRKHRASGAPEPVQQFSEGEAVAPTRKHGASTLRESSEGRDQLSAPFLESRVVSPKELASTRKHQVLGSPDEVPGAVQHFSEGQPASMKKHRASGAPERVQQFCVGEALTDCASSVDQCEVLQQSCEGQAVVPEEPVSTRNCSRTRDETPRKGVPEPVQQFCVGEAPRECALSTDQCEVLEHFCEGQAVVPEEQVSTRKRQSSRTRDVTPGKELPEAAQQGEALRECASSMDQSQVLQHSCEGQAVVPEEPASTRQCQTLRTRDGTPRKEVPEPVQQFCVDERGCASPMLQHACEGQAVEELASARKCQASRTREETPREGVPEPAQEFTENKSEHASSRKRQRQVSEPGGSSKSNLVASVRSFLPLVLQQPAVPIANGRKDVRVKALEAAEAARRLEEKRLEDRKRKFESLKREKLPEQKTRLDQEKQKKFEEEQRKKDDERKKKELELNAKKRKKDEVEKKEREEKRRKVEDAMRQKKEQEEKLRAELEEKEQRRKALEEAERERKGLEDEMKKQKRLEKEREIERRRKADEDAKAAWLASKEAERKRREETFQRMKVLEKEQRSHGAGVIAASELPVRGTSLNLAKQSLGLEKEQRSHGAGVFGTSELPARGTSLNLVKKSLGLDGAGEKFLGTPALRIRSCGGSRMLPVVPITDLEESDDDEPTSYEISPYKSSSEDEGEGRKQKKVKTVPRWARKENLMLHLMRQVHIDPDAIFSGAKSCSLNEVFGTTGNKKRRDFSQRSGSGDWLADMVTWKEELEYKKTMGYLQPRAG